MKNRLLQQRSYFQCFIQQCKYNASIKNQSNKNVLKSENIIQNKKREGIPIQHKAMCVEKGANPNIIPCIISSGLLNSYTSLFPIIMHIYIQCSMPMIRHCQLCILKPSSGSKTEILSAFFFFFNSFTCATSLLLRKHDFTHMEMCQQLCLITIKIPFVRKRI